MARKEQTGIFTFLKKYVLESIVLVVLTGLVVGWLKGLLTPLLPGTETPRCWSEEYWQAAFGRLPAADPTAFTVLVATLDQDLDGSQTKYLVHAIRGGKSPVLDSNTADAPLDRPKPPRLRR